MLKRMIKFSAVAALALAPAPAAQAQLSSKPGGFTPPAGLNEGDTYHLAFVSSGTHDAQSTNIAVYNAFVQGAADAAGIGNTAKVSWYAICSTSAVDAKDNAVVEGPVYLYDLTTPILLALDAAAMWDANTDHLLHKFDTNENGNTGVGKPYVWTGTQLDGTVRNNGLAGPGATYYADPRGFGTWVMKTGGDFGDGSSTDEFWRTMRFFALSEPLKVVSSASGALIVIK